MGIIDEFLEKNNLKYDDLKAVERETLHTWLSSLEKNQLSIEKIKEYIETMRDSVEQELTKVSFGSKEDTLLKARLRNYMLLGAFLTSPEKAKRAVDAALRGIQVNIKGK